MNILDFLKDAVEEIIKNPELLEEAREQTQEDLTFLLKGVKAGFEVAVEIAELAMDIANGVRAREMYTGIVFTAAMNVAAKQRSGVIEGVDA